MRTQQLNPLFTAQSDDRDWLDLAGKIVRGTAVNFSGGQRLGQALFNATPYQLSGRLAGTPADPFNNDENIPAYVSELFEVWLDSL